MRGSSIYLQVALQMYLKGWDSATLAKECNMNYTSLRRKLLGTTDLTLREAKLIKHALGADMSLDELFAIREKSDDAA